MGLTAEKEKVEHLVYELNRAWTEGRIDDLYTLFDERVVAVVAGGAGRVEGREAMVESFRKFLAVARVHDFQVTGVAVDLFGPAAVATFGFTIRYELSGETYDETGSEILVYTKSGESWRIVWRTQIPSAPNQ